LQAIATFITDDLIEQFNYVDASGNADLVAQEALKQECGTVLRNRFTTMSREVAQSARRVEQEMNNRSRARARPDDDDQDADEDVPETDQSDLRTQLKAQMVISQKRLACHKKRKIRVRCTTAPQLHHSTAASRRI
jgi:hypothetical protein